MRAERSNPRLKAVQAEAYVGKRVKLSGSVKTEALAGNATLFFRADAGRELTVCHDYMEGRELTGTNDWTECECVIDIPGGTSVLLSDEGKVWFSKVALEPTSDDVEVTDTKADIQARQQPVNMCFEEG